jgi:hypothetical protein
MSVCGQCGLALEQGAAHCSGCGAPVASPDGSADEGQARPAEEKPKWGTLIRAPRPVTGPLEVPNAMGGGEALPVPRMPVVRNSVPEPPRSAGDRQSRGTVAGASVPEPPRSGGDRQSPGTVAGASVPEPPRSAGDRQSPGTVARAGVADTLPGSLSAEAHAQAARAARRAPSAPLAAEPRHPAMRAPSGPIAGAVALPGAKVRAPSGPLAQAGAAQRKAPVRAPSAPIHPAMRAPSGPITGSVALPGAKPRAPSGAFAVNLPPSAASDPANSNHLDTGMLELDDRFSDQLQAGPSLEVASLSPHAQPRQERPSPQPPPHVRREAPRRDSPKPVPRESPAELRAKRIRDLARYPAVPEKWIGAVAYFWRVYSRRRELESQVQKLTQQRKRLDLANDDALFALGQALYAKRDEPELQPLAAQLRVVGESAQEVGARTAAAKRTEAGLSQEIAGLEQELAAAQAAAEPVQAREATLSKTLDLHLQQIKRREMLIRKGEVDAKTDPSRLPEFQTERELHRSEIQAMQAKLPPIEVELASVRGSLEKQRAQIASLQERLRKLQGQMGREHERERVSVGGSQSAHREALRSLATAAMKYEISATVTPAEHKAAFEARQIADAQRESEELMRAAVSCYDADVYKRGMQLVMGATIGVFLLFIALIFL